MPGMTTIQDRVQPALPADREVRFGDLRTLHASDAEAVYELALAELPTDAPPALRGLQVLARTLSLLMRESFVIGSAANQHFASTPQRHGLLALDDGADDVAFLRSLYSGGSDRADHKMQSQKRSEAYTSFFLDEHAWDANVRSTRLLRVDHQDTKAVVNGSPAYHFGSLLDSAREVVRCPTAVYEGLRTDGDLKGGLAFCGKASRRWTNVGHEPPPSNFVFMVFASSDGCVFDWDWVPECKENPGRPRNAAERFPHGEVKAPVCGELLLGNVRGLSPAPFKPEHAWYSTKGDCVFWYLSDHPAYADRYDDYLTAFFDAETGANLETRCVGFKLKSVSRLIKTIREWSMPGSGEGIKVLFDPVKPQITLSYLMRAWQAAALPQSQDLFPAMILMRKLGDEGVRAIQHAQPIALPAEMQAAEAFST
ncbi:MAG: hypothetical protein KF699_11750 [Phycisphaeraceae bacterium]|nr:hypothetical protein [Phycisphaeraceae bacterium]